MYYSLDDDIVTQMYCSLVYVIVTERFSFMSLTYSGVLIFAYFSGKTEIVKLNPATCLL